MLGDANLCAKKWKNSDFLHKAVAEEILSSIAQCGLITHDLGFTYLADRLTPEGEAIQSALDHVYIKEAQSLGIAKSLIKKYCRTLVI